jgi:hypothetical protein
MNGASEMIAKLKQIQAKFPDRVAAALYQIAQQIMSEAKRRTPVASDGGVLRASGLVSQPVRDGRGVSVTMSFGGAADAYAIAVHEHISAHDPPSWKIMVDNGRMIQWTTPGTGDHFLSSVIDEYTPVLPTMLAALLNLEDESAFTVVA